MTLVCIPKDIGQRSATLACEWSEGAVKAGSVYRFSTSTRRKPYVDLLVASDKAKKDTEVQVAGFSGERDWRCFFFFVVFEGIAVVVVVVVGGVVLFEGFVGGGV